MFLSLNKPANVFIFMLSIVVTLALMPQQADARKGKKGSGKTHSSVNRSSNRNRNKNVNVNSNRNVNRNVNVNKNVNVDVDVDHHGGCCHGGHNPIATGVAIGATVAITSAIIGSMVNTLPAGCTTVITNGISYSQCGSTWYEPRYSGSSVTYVVVNAP